MRPFRSWAVGGAALLLLLVGACDGGDDRSGDEDADAPSPAESPEENGRADAEQPPPTEAAIELEEVVGGLDAPLYVTQPGDGTEMLFVVEQAGRIRIVRDGEVAAEPFLDISEVVQAGGEQGLLGLAFDPDYDEGGRFFINYTNLSGDTVVARYRAPETDRADPASERVLLEIPQPFANHNGGHLAFGPDGHLYIATGDGGSGGDPQGNGQNVDTLLGKLLRIDVSGDDYQNPSDNPFVDRDGARPEIWAYGLRNPWRFSFDSETDDLWIADVGQSDREEINLEPADSEGGLNYGWNVMEGTECFGGGSCDDEGLEPPVAEYDTNSDGCSVTGGYVYRGQDVPGLVGGYVYGDYCSGNVWILDAERPRMEPALALQTGHSISSFGQGEDGELFVVDHGGTLLRVVSAGN